MDMDRTPTNRIATALRAVAQAAELAATNPTAMPVFRAVLAKLEAEFQAATAVGIGRPNLMVVR